VSRRGANGNRAPMLRERQFAQAFVLYAAGTAVCMSFRPVPARVPAAYCPSPYAAGTAVCTSFRPVPARVPVAHCPFPHAAGTVVCTSFRPVPARVPAAYCPFPYAAGTVVCTSFRPVPARVPVAYCPFPYVGNGSLHKLSPCTGPSSRSILPLPLCRERRSARAFVLYRPEFPQHTAPPPMSGTAVCTSFRPVPA
jgi:hypothetical protein